MAIPPAGVVPVTLYVAVNKSPVAGLFVKVWSMTASTSRTSAPSVGPHCGPTPPAHTVEVDEIPLPEKRLPDKLAPAGLRIEELVFS